MTSTNMHGAKPGKVTPKNKAAGRMGTTATQSVSITDSTAQFKPNNHPSKFNYSRKSTSVDAQYQRIDRAFDHVGKLISTLDFRKMGVLHPAGRIREMNLKLGFYIPTVDLRTVIDEQGFPHLRIAFYELIDRPKKGGAHHE